MSKAKSNASKKKKKPKHANKHTVSARDELFTKALAKAPGLKKWMQSEGIWIKELFQFLVIDLKITKTQHIAQKITSNEEFDEVIRLVKIKRSESVKDMEEMKRLEKNLYKFEKLWREKTGITKKAKKVKIKKKASTNKIPPKPSPEKPKKMAPRMEPIVHSNPKPKTKPPSKPAPPKPPAPQQHNLYRSKSSAPPSKPKPPKLNRLQKSSSFVLSNNEKKCEDLEKQAQSFCNKAEQFEKATSFKFYSLGIIKLFKTLPFIKQEKKKKQRIKQIDGMKVKKHQCHSTLSSDKLARRQHEKKGMELCLLAEQYEYKQGYEVAAKYYTKGIPLLQKSVKNLDHTLSKQYKLNKIKRFQTNFEKCQILQSKKKNKQQRTKWSLFEYVGQGNVDNTIIQNADIKNLYLLLPILISAMSHIPISFQYCFRDKLLSKLNEIIENEPVLEQRLRCYLFSYSFDKNIYFNSSLKSIYRYHPCMPQLSYNIFDDDEDEKHDNNKKSRKDDKNTFESCYFERDCISFLRTNILNNVSLVAKLSSKIFSKQIIKQVDDDIVMYDLFGSDVQISSFEIQKVFKSNRGIVSDEESKYINYNLQYIVKLGDDLRRDQAVSSMFKLMNYFWNREGLKYNKQYDIECLTYSVIPMGVDFGAIEYIPDCVSLSKIGSLKKDKSVKKKVASHGNDVYKDNMNNPFLCKLVASAAAAYIACFICGIRDRHYDNILIRKTDGCLFHIDFNYLWAKVGLLDASKMAITKDLKIFMGDLHWKGFVNVAVEAYLVIRRHYNEIISFGRDAFDFITYSDDKKIKPMEFLYKSMRISMDEEEAKEYIRRKLESAPNAIKTKLKNVMHKIATN